MTALLRVSLEVFSVTLYGKCLPEIFHGTPSRVYFITYIYESCVLQITSCLSFRIINYSCVTNKANSGQGGRRGMHVMVERARESFDIEDQRRTRTRHTNPP